MHNQMFEAFKAMTLHCSRSPPSAFELLPFSALSHLPAV